jgi:ubiquinone/menaquinone biosynthesis C-methylase UbiE
LLDIGCGNGTRTIRFSKYVKEKTLGLDYSQIMIKHARKTLEKEF